MSQVVNFNRVRKSRARIEAGKTAEINRVKFGRTRAEREAAQREQERAARALDQARRDET